jgi:hypothetical protein
MLLVIFLIYFAILAVVLYLLLGERNAGRRAGEEPMGNQENIEAHRPPSGEV